MIELKEKYKNLYILNFKVRNYKEEYPVIL